MAHNRNVICHANHKSHLSHHVFIKCVDIFSDPLLIYYRLLCVVYITVKITLLSWRRDASVTWRDTSVSVTMIITVTLIVTVTVNMTVADAVIVTDTITGTMKDSAGQWGMVMDGYRREGHDGLKTVTGR